MDPEEAAQKAEIEEEDSVSGSESESIEDSASPVAAIFKQANVVLEGHVNADSVTEEVLVEAITKFKSCIQTDPAFLPARFGLVYVHGLAGNPDGGLEELAAIEAIGTEDERLQEMKAHLLEMKQEALAVPVIVGLIEGGKILPKFFQVLVACFKRFDADNDGGLSDAELDALHKVVNDAPISPAALNYFKHHCDTNSKGQLTLDGLVSHYFAQTLEDPEETYKDLAKLGYNRNLDPL